MGKKKELLVELFEHCRQVGNMEFDNDLVKQLARKHGFGNPFDVTKIDNSAKLPEDLRSADYFLIHLGEGRHRFVKGISLGYHTFEPILNEESIEWKYRKSLLNEFDTSESTILSVASNQRILHDFLYDDIVASPKVYNSRKTNTDLTYWIGNQFVNAHRLQIEIDLTVELHGHVTVFEGKKGFPEDFAIYQIFHPFKYYTNLKNANRLPVHEITGCYVLQKQGDQTSTLRIYNYTFDDSEHLESIRLLKKAQYQLIRR
jgi:hypothetical protein